MTASGGAFPKHWASHGNGIAGHNPPPMSDISLTSFHEDAAMPALEQSFHQASTLPSTMAYPLIAFQHLFCKPAVFQVIWLTCWGIVLNQFVAFNGSEWNKVYYDINYSGDANKQIILGRVLTGIAFAPQIAVEAWWTGSASGLPTRSYVILSVVVNTVAFGFFGLYGYCGSTIVVSAAFGVFTAQRHALMYCTLLFRLTTLPVARLVLEATPLIRECLEKNARYLAGFQTAILCCIYEHLIIMVFTKLWKRYHRKASPFILSFAMASIVTYTETIRLCSMLDLAAPNLHDDGDARVSLNNYYGLFVGIRLGLGSGSVSIMSETMTRIQFLQAAFAQLIRGKHAVLTQEKDLLLRMRWGSGYPPVIIAFVMLAWALLPNRISNGIGKAQFDFTRDLVVWELVFVNFLVEALIDISVLIAQRSLRRAQAGVDNETLSESLVRLHEPGQNLVMRFPPSALSQAEPMDHPSNEAMDSEAPPGIFGCSAYDLAAVWIVSIVITTGPAGLMGSFGSGDDHWCTTKAD